ncbi:MAG: type II toxin-antitoxin system HipA family toxin [Acidobacteria bacterium]|nr:type II toxin-antitoxin system HipA family toxin [Acidobacteriota bacterium]
MLVARRNAGREVFEFAYDDDVCDTAAIASVPIDPRLGFYPGRQYPPAGRETFGMFDDSSPDRWGRLLMKRRLERDQRAGRIDPTTRLHASDFLLGVHDRVRLGALRFRIDDAGDFLDNRADMPAPPFVQLRSLEEAVRRLELDEDNSAPDADAWLTMLLAPGASLGGARPKASVVDPDGHLWIAKFPSVNDDTDIGAWELVVQTLARSCGLRVPPAMARRFASKHHTYLVRRFDRTAAGRRLHFASAMTLTDHRDGEDASTGASYLEIAEVLIAHGVETNVDLRELWSRIVFNVLVSNADDHLRNHGFILVPGRGWKLSEAYDMNPVPESTGLRLNIGENDNAMDLELVRSVAPYFRVKKSEGDEIVARFRSVVAQWRQVARKAGISDREQIRMAPAFRLAT